jgi:hypothetical protein
VRSDSRAKLAAIGAGVDGGTPEQLRGRMAQEPRDWAEIVGSTGITSIDWSG